MIVRRIAIAGALLGSILICVAQPVLAGEENREPDVATAEAGAERHFVLYYFHGQRRCQTCLTIEAYAEEAARAGFGKELESGVLEWTVVNIDEKENAHFVEDFSLPSSSLVVVEMGRDGPVRHQILQDVWLLVGKKQEFLEYIRRAVREYLG